MNREELMQELSDGTFANVKFVKRTNGEVRSMTGRLGVTRYLKNKGKAFDDKEKGLLTVFDTQKQAYRSISCESILEVKAHGKVWNPEEGWKNA